MKASEEFGFAKINLANIQTKQPDQVCYQLLNQRISNSFYDLKNHRLINLYVLNLLWYLLDVRPGLS